MAEQVTGESMNAKRETVGKISSELLTQAPETRDPIELQREMQKNYIDNLVLAVGHAQKKFNCTTLHEGESCDYAQPREGDFYIVVISKKEPLMQNVLRNYFLTRDACPTPDYDQAVYKYIKETEQIEFLWVVPSKDTCLLFKQNALQVPASEQHLLKFVLDFADGTLFKLAKKLNGEAQDSPLLER